MSYITYGHEQRPKRTPLQQASPKGLEGAKAASQVGAADTATHSVENDIGVMRASQNGPGVALLLQASRRIAKTHTGKERRFECQCGKRFRKREHLKRHDQLVHRLERPYSCTVCDADFGTKQNMQVHFATRKHRFRVMTRRDKKALLQAGAAPSSELATVDGKWDEEDKVMGSVEMDEKLEE